MWKKVFVKKYRSDVGKLLEWRVECRGRGMLLFGGKWEILGELVFRMTIGEGRFC